MEVLVSILQGFGAVCGLLLLFYVSKSIVQAIQGKYKD
jgi:hypothetical protein